MGRTVQPTTYAGIDPLYMKTVQIELFTFEELAPEVQKKVIEDNRYLNVEYFDWYHSIIEEWTAKLEEAGYMEPEILFSGFYSQGDGASFTAKLDMEKFLTGKYEALRGLELSGSVIRHNSRYVHENSTHVEIHDTEGNATKEQDALILDLEQDLNAKILSINKEIYKDLEDDYEFQTSDEVVRECLINQEGHYEKNGKQRYD